MTVEATDLWLRGFIVGGVLGGHNMLLSGLLMARVHQLNGKPPKPEAGLKWLSHAMQTVACALEVAVIAGCEDALESSVTISALLQGITVRLNKRGMFDTDHEKNEALVLFMVEYMREHGWLEGKDLAEVEARIEAAAKQRTELLERLQKKRTGVAKSVVEDALSQAKGNR